MSKIMERAEHYAICTGETYGNPEAKSREVCRQELQAEVTRMETELAELRAEKLAREGQGAQSEPVAWGVRSFDGVIRDCIGPDTHDAHPGAYILPLYLAAGAKPALVPMTETEIRKSCTDWFDVDGTTVHSRRTSTNITEGIVGVARAIEAHHKIGAKP